MAVPDPAQQQPPPEQRQQTPVAPFVAAATPFVLAPAGPVIAGVAAKQLTGAALRTAVEGLIEGFAELAEQRYKSGHEFTHHELARVHPTRKPSELAKLLAQEAKFEKEFRRKMAARLGVDLREALSVPDPAERIERLKRVFEREKRYSVLREEAMFLRALGKADAMQLRESSPEGAYWKLSEFVKEHTLDCLAMGEKFWPWEVLEAFQPPVHHGCACWLLGLDEAVGEGLMTPDQIPDKTDAIFRARQAQKLAEQLEENVDPVVIREYIEEPARAAGNVHALRRPIDTSLILQEGAKHSGAMVALYPPRTLAKALALDGGEPVEEMHVTLAFLGEAKDLSNIGALTKAVEGFAASCPPISGEISGSGKFTGGPEPVVYASVDLPGLPAQRERLVDALKGAGSPALNNHGFTPHMTLAYDDRDVDVRARPVTFNAVSLVLGGKRLDFRLRGTALEEAHEHHEQLRYPKGFEHGGEFRPKTAVLKKLIPHPRSPLATRHDRRGRWSWINGVYTRIPEADHWEKTVAGHHYVSPAGSTNVYKDGKHFDGMGHVSPEKRIGLRSRKPATPEVIQKAADAARADLRAPRVVSPAMPPVQIGDAPSRLHALKGQGWRLAGVVGKALRWQHPSGANLETEFDGKRVSKVNYDPAGPPAEVGKALGRPPHNFDEFRQDSVAWAHELSDRFGAPLKLGEIVIDPSLDDHAGQHLWSGKTMLGPDTETSINDAGAARAAGRKLTDAQKRGVWSSYWNAAHELSHAVNPISPHSFLADDGVDANLEEALGEELAHVHATERLQETGQNDVLRWREEHPNSPSVVGVYSQERFSLGKLLDEAGLSDSFDRRLFLEDLKYRVAPDERAGAIADAIKDHGDERTRQELIEHVRGVMTSNRGYGSALPLINTSPGKAQVGDAYGRFAGAQLSKDGNTLTLADGSRRVIERLAVPEGNPRLAAITDGSAIVAYGPGQPETPGMSYADGKPKTFRFLDNAERGRLILRGLTGTGSPGATAGTLKYDGRTLRVEPYGNAWRLTEKTTAPSSGTIGGDPYEEDLDATEVLGVFPSKQEAIDYGTRALGGKRVRGPQSPGSEDEGPGKNWLKSTSSITSDTMIRRWLDDWTGHGEVTPEDLSQEHGTAGHAKTQIVAPEVMADAMRLARERLDAGDDTKTATKAVKNAVLPHVYQPPYASSVAESAVAAAIHNAGPRSPGTNFGLREIYEPGDTAEDIARKLEGQKQWVAVNTVPVKRRFDGTYGVGFADYDGRRLSGVGSAKSAAETALIRSPKNTAGPMSPGIGDMKPGEMVRNKRFGTIAEILEPQSGDQIRVRWLGTGVEAKVPAHMLEPFDQADPAGAENEDAWIQHLLSQGQGELPPGEQQALFAAGKKTTKKTWDPLEGLEIGGDETAPEPDGEIPVYDRTRLTLRDRAGGSNGARWAEDEDNHRWLVKAYQGDQDRVATEVLANAVYRATGAKVPVAGTITMPPEKPNFKNVPDRDLNEPPMPKKEKGRNVSTGMVVIDNGKLVLIRPKGGFGGYDYTIPKGRKEWGLTGQQNAAKEVWEETGLHATPVAYLGDYEGDTGVTRMYMGVRTGGEPHPDDPTPHVKGSGKESESVHIVTFEEAADMLNRSRDQRILDDAFDHAQDLPTEVPDQFPHPLSKPAVTYPTLDGETHYNFKPSEKLGEHYMTDALLGNWDFVGLTGDNVIWDENGDPIRLDQGGTFEFRAQGDPKPFGPIPADVWTMLSKGQGARGVKVTEDQMRQQAEAIARKLTPEKIDGLVDAAPFTDNAMRERIRDNLKARVGWMDQFAHGTVDLPRPAEGDAAHDALFEAQRDLTLFPEQEDTLMKFLGSPTGMLVQNALHDPKRKRPKSVQRAIDELDSLMRHAETEEDVIAWLPIATKKPENLVGKVVTSKKLIGMDVERPDAPVVARVVVPGGTSAVYTGLWEDMPEGTPDLLVTRDAKIKITGYEDGVLHGTLKTQRPFKPWKPQKQQFKNPWKKPEPKDELDTGPELKETEWLVEGRFDKQRHPRGRGGRWIDSLGNKLADKDTTIGVTPFLTDRKEAGPMSPGTSARPFDKLVPDAPIHDFGTAAALHQDPRWGPLWTAFESDADKLAKKHDVEIVRGERNVGVFEGNYEPSYAITLSGDKKNIDAYNKALGAKYHQKAVVGFTADPKGADAELRFTGGTDPSAFFGDLKSVMGDDAGASFDSDTWRVFVFHGAADSKDTAKKLIDLGRKRGMNVKFVAGTGDYFQLREGAG